MPNPEPVHARTITSVAIALIALYCLGACASDDAGGAGASGTAASTGGTSGAGGTSGVGGQRGAAGMERTECVNTGEDVITCPDAVGPFTGSCASKGECCHRSSNKAKAEALGPDEPLELEYRVTQSAVTNHPASTSLPTLLMGAAERARTCAGEQCFLWRFVQPRMGGEPVAGAGKSSNSIGRYNCDGTYSYYNDAAAPPRAAEGFTDPARWNVVTADTQIDPTMDGVARTHIAWASDPNQYLSTSPFFMSGTQRIDWELASSGFEMLAFDTTDPGRDCQGAWNGTEWTTPGLYQTFAPLESNSKDIIDSVTQTFCQLLSFGVLAPEDRGEDCLQMPRCMPGSADCMYQKLPDALCPEDDTQRGIYRCHLGAQGNINQEEGYPADLNCTMEAPSTPLDPDVDATVSKGQCCDPLAAGTDGLPPCNAFRVISRFAAAAAEITSNARGDLPPICSGT